MKKVMTFIICLLVLAIIAIPIYVYASDEPNQGSEATKEPVEQGVPTFWGRVSEWGNDNVAQIVTVASSAVLGFLTWLVRRATKTGNKDITDALNIVSANTATNPQVIDTVNQLISGFSEMSAQYEKYGLTENDRDKSMIAVTAMCSAVLEMLHEVYSNSANRPTGTKDVLNVHYAHCKKVIDGDAELKQAVSAVTVGGKS